MVSIPALLIRGDGWSSMRATLDKVIALIAYYEMKEATTILELALWKAKMDQAQGKLIEDRGVYRIDVPGPVKDAILQYL